MPTVDGILREMVFRHQPIGRVENIASLAAQTATVTALATGGLSAQEFVDKWMVRPETATAADLIRRCTSFVSSTGVLTHTGTAYTDTTATDEQLLILKHQLYLALQAIDIGIGSTKRLHETYLPTLFGAKRYWLNDLSWIESPGDIESVWWSDCPVFSRNRFFDDYHSYTTAGILQPDFWTISGASATMARSTTQQRRGQWSLAITRSGTDAAVTQTPGLLENGVTGDSLRGDTVTVFAWCWSAVASQVRIRITDGVDTTNSSYHTGNSTWQELTASHAVNAAATTLAISVRVEADNTVAYVDEAGVSQIYDDAVRRDSYPRHPLAATEYIQNGVPALYLSERGHNGQYVVKSYRAYPRLDSARVTSGAALSDTTDIPLELAAVHALWRLYRNIGDEKEESRWQRIYNQMGPKHTASSSDVLPIIRAPMAIAARRP